LTPPQGHGLDLCCTPPMTKTPRRPREEWGSVAKTTEPVIEFPPFFLPYPCRFFLAPNTVTLPPFTFFQEKNISLTEPFFFSLLSDFHLQLSPRHRAGAPVAAPTRPKSFRLRVISPPVSMAPRDPVLSRGCSYFFTVSILVYSITRTASSSRHPYFPLVFFLSSTGRRVPPVSPCLA